MAEYYLRERFTIDHTVRGEGVVKLSGKLMKIKKNVKCLKDSAANAADITNDRSFLITLLQRKRCHSLENTDITS